MTGFKSESFNNFDNNSATKRSIYHDSSLNSIDTGLGSSVFMTSSFTTPGTIQVECAINKNNFLITEESESARDSSYSCSEIDESIKTEEFSELFNKYNLTNENLKLHDKSSKSRPKKSKRGLKQLAGITITSFDPNCIDSDLDTIRSELVRDTIREIKRSKSTEDKAVDNDTLIERCQQILKDSYSKRLVYFWLIAQISMQLNHEPKLECQFLYLLEILK